MEKLRFLVVMCVLMLVVGCGETSTVVEATPPAPEEHLKVVLDELIKSGEPMGSGGMVLQDSIQLIRENNPAKADELSSLANDLMAEMNPAQVKAKAKAMRDKL